MSSSHNAAAPAPARNGLVVLALLLVYVVWGSTYLVICIALAGGAQGVLQGGSTAVQNQVANHPDKYAAEGYHHHQ